MSKLWSGILAICLVFTSVVVIAEMTANDADAENAYVKYDITGSTNAWEFAPGDAEGTYTGNAKMTLLKVDGNDYTVRLEENMRGTFITSSDVGAFEIGVESDYELTDSRVGIGEKVTNVWEYKDGEYTYQVCSDKKLDLASIYRLTAINDSDTVCEKHIIDFDDDGNVKSWTFERKYCAESTDGELPYLRDIPDGAKIVSQKTHFGVRDVVDLEGQIIDAKTGLVLEVESERTYYLLMSTNIRL